MRKPYNGKYKRGHAMDIFLNIFLMYIMLLLNDLLKKDFKELIS